MDKVNYNLIGIVSLVAGVILIYSAVTARDPKAVVVNALQGKTAPVLPHGNNLGTGTLKKVPNPAKPSSDTTTPGDGTQVVSV